ncbi:MAG TPA: hypothetical protein PKD90_02360, partial [Phnomibacter sp.]|nr:hypothetical protein [Phnomibacter sp.]
PAGKGFTLLFYDSAQRYKTWLVRTDWAQTPVAGKAFLQMLPMIMGGSNLSIENDTGRVLFSGRRFADFANQNTMVFTQVDTTRLKLRLVQGTGASRQVLDSFNSFGLQQGRSYTIFTSGVLGQAGNYRPRMWVYAHE